MLKYVLLWAVGLFMVAAANGARAADLTPAQCGAMAEYVGKQMDARDIGANVYKLIVAIRARNGTLPPEVLDAVEEGIRWGFNHPTVDDETVGFRVFSDCINRKGHYEPKIGI